MLCDCTGRLVAVRRLRPVCTDNELQLAQWHSAKPVCGQRFEAWFEVGESGVSWDAGWVNLVHVLAFWLWNIGVCYNVEGSERKWVLLFLLISEPGDHCWLRHTDSGPVVLSDWAFVYTVTACLFSSSVDELVIDFFFVYTFLLWVILMISTVRDWHINWVFPEYINIQYGSYPARR